MWKQLEQVSGIIRLTFNSENVTKAVHVIEIRVYCLTI